ncbi:TadE/TadG family type IV pilus assembly protein [Aurantiacibacter suaedae]|uniref:TadE/TadG family type IV pilus assembly protein n=1 Tax=Aurantiacibacter suaedae TaxID=2545755 RepID=UPI0010F79249|nr:TadE/TadG family type IV pilus assembly protein [Aurantiacibacter suaedae]
MRRRAVDVLRRLLSCTRGVALVEFAYALPLMLLLYFGAMTVSELIAVNRKVTVATRSLADLVSRTISPAIIYNDPNAVGANNLLSASAVAMAPYKLDAATQQISLLRVCDATRAYVVWTRARTQNADGTTGSAIASTDIAGTLPNAETQPEDAIVAIPGNMVSPNMIPVSPDGSNVCDNLDPGTSSATQVGTAGAYLYRGTVTYTYTPPIDFLSWGATDLSDTIYMAPRLY